MFAYCYIFLVTGVHVQYSVGETCVPIVFISRSHIDFAYQDVGWYQNWYICQFLTYVLHTHPHRCHINTINHKANGRILLNVLSYSHINFLCHNFFFLLSKKTKTLMILTKLGYENITEIEETPVLLTSLNITVHIYRICVNTSTRRWK